MKLVSVAYMFLLSVFSFGQDMDYLDSLENELRLSKSDTANILLRSKIGFEGWILREGYWDSIAKDCRKYLKNSKLSSREVFIFKEQLGTALMSVAYVKSNDGMTDEAFVLYEETLILKQEIDDKEGIATIYNNLANIFDDKGDIPKALEYYKKSIDIREDIGDVSGVSSTLNNLAYLYTELEEYDIAIENFTKSLEMSKELEEPISIGLALNNLGYVYHQQGDLVTAEKYHRESLALREEIGDLKGIAMSNNNLGKVAKDNENYEDALSFFNVSLQIYEDNNYVKGIGTTLSNMGEAYMAQKNYVDADKCIQKSLDIANELGFPIDIKIAAKMLSEISKYKGNWKRAMEMHELFILMRDSLRNIENNKLAIKQSLQYEYEKRTLADSVLTAEEKKVTNAQIEMQQAQLDKEKTNRYTLYGGLGVLLVFGLFMYNRFRISRKQNGIINDQKEIVQEKNKEILDSIKYAKRIQSAILPPIKIINSHFKEYFIVYKPKDIVSGDFYWLETSKNTITSQDVVLFAIADCTGHGVPGAMVSVVCNNGLNRSVREHGLTDPGEILNKTREIVIEEFSKSEEDVVDGMDISLCSIEGSVMKWAGANNPLWIVRNGKLLEFLPNKQPIGKYAFPELFLTHEVSLEKDDRIYIFSDGFQDQFGGVKGKKYKVKNLKTLFLSISEKPMEKQRDIIESAFEEWKSDLEQIDDICIMGVKI